MSHTRRFLLYHLPLIIGLALALTVNCVASANRAIGHSDYSEVFQVAGRALLSGQNPYIATAPFLYPPLALPLFAALSLISPVVWLLINGWLLTLAMYRLRLGSYWMILSPYALFALVAGQVDILALTLCVYSIAQYDTKQSHDRASWALLLALIIKPQIALFFWLGWVHAHGWRKALLIAWWWLALNFAAFLIMPQSFATAWLTQLTTYGFSYVGMSASFLSLGLILPAIGAAILWLIVGARHGNVRAKPFLALALPATRYYSLIALIDVAPAYVLLAFSWGVTILLLATGLPLLWLDPALIIVYQTIATWQRGDNSQRDGVIIPPLAPAPQPTPIAHSWATISSYVPIHGIALTQDGKLYKFDGDTKTGQRMVEELEDATPILNDIARQQRLIDFAKRMDEQYGGNRGAWHE